MPSKLHINAIKIAHHYDFMEDYEDEKSLKLMSDTKAGFFNNLFKNPILIALLMLVLLGIFIFGSTYGEVLSLVNSASTCKTSGCVRSTRFGAIFLLFIMPIIVMLFSGLQFFILKFSLQWAEQKITLLELIFMTLFPFVITSIIFPILTSLIYDPGYQTEARFLAFILVKAGLIILNALILCCSFSLLYRPNWRKLLISMSLPLVLFSILFIQNITKAKPYLHYLNEEKTYRLAKHYLIDIPIHRAHCQIDENWCWQEFLNR